MHPSRSSPADAIAAAEAACGVGSVFADAGDYFSGRRPSFRATIFVDFGVFHENPRTQPSPGRFAPVWSDVRARYMAGFADVDS
jgi:hypothetical protein